MTQGEARRCIEDVIKELNPTLPWKISQKLLGYGFEDNCFVKLIVADKVMAAFDKELFQYAPHLVKEHVAKVFELVSGY